MNNELVQYDTTTKYCHKCGASYIRVILFCAIISRPINTIGSHFIEVGDITLTNNYRYNSVLLDYTIHNKTRKVSYHDSYCSL